MTGVTRHDAVEFMRVVARRALRRRRRLRATPVRFADQPPCHPEGMGIIVGEMVHHARLPRVHVAATECLRVHAFPGSCLHERRSAEEDRALLAHDDGLIAHGRDIRAARRAGAHHDCELRDAAGRQLRLVVEDAPEMLAVGKDVVLPRQNAPPESTR